MMGNVYTVSGFHAIDATTEQEIISVEADTVNPFTVLSARVGQSSDQGDAAAEMLRIQLGRYTSTQGEVGGAAASDNPHQQGDPTSALNGYVGSTTMSLTKTVIIEDAWNIQAGYLYMPTPEEWIDINPGTGFFISIPTGPLDSLDVSVSVTVSEMMLQA